METLFSRLADGWIYKRGMRIALGGFITNGELLVMLYSFHPIVEITVYGKGSLAALTLATFNLWTTYTVRGLSANQRAGSQETFISTNERPSRHSSTSVQQRQDIQNSKANRQEN